MRLCYVNAPEGEEVDYAQLLPWLEAEYPDGWVIVHGRLGHSGLVMAMLGFGGDDVLVPLFPVEGTRETPPFRHGEDRCGYCRHGRREHSQPANVACNHPMCQCFCFEEVVSGK